MFALVKWTRVSLYTSNNVCNVIKTWMHAKTDYIITCCRDFFLNPTTDISDESIYAIINLGIFFFHSIRTYIVYILREKCRLYTATYIFIYKDTSTRRVGIQSWIRALVEERVSYHIIIGIHRYTYRFIRQWDFTSSAINNERVQVWYSQSRGAHTHTHTHTRFYHTTNHLISLKTIRIELSKYVFVCVS